MHSVKPNIILLLVSFISLISHGQDIEPQQMIESILESQLDKLDEQTDVALIIEDLEELLENPININATNATELSKLYLLNEVQINKLLEFVEEFGTVYTIFELNTIDGFTPDILKKMQSFIRFGAKEKEQLSLQDQLKEGRHEALFRSLGTLQNARGYKVRDDGTTPYEGNRFRYYGRYKFEISEKLSAGLTAEKDPGEAFFRGSNKQGFDYYSGHLSLQFNHTIKSLYFGDFIVRSGQGLVLWQGYTNGKSVDVLGISKRGQGVRPYTSAGENAFFRGAAATLEVRNIEMIVFGSHKKADANIVSEEAENTYFTSLQTSGYHRTDSEIEDEKSVGTTDFGTILNFQHNNLKIGATFVYQRFTLPFIPSNQIYNQFRFHGDENYTAGINYLFNKGKYTLFGEVAASKSGGLAVLQGAIAHINDRLSFSALFRNYEKDYHALWANTFAEGTNISNESGLYFGTRFLPAKHVTLSLYSDIYESKWTNYSTIGPSRGWDVFAQADFSISERFSFYLRHKYEEKEQKFKAENRYINIPEGTRKTRLHFDYQLSESIKLKTRLEHVHFKSEESENGFMLFQDIQYSPNKLPLSLSGRIAWFHIESYNSRIYAYENDLLYTFSVPAFYGKGFRTYLNAKYRISSKLECWLKFANTHWTDRNVISSGYNEINGRDKTELKIQFRLKF